MLRCDLARCDKPAVVLVHFKGIHTPYPYCGNHAYDRKGRSVFRQRILAAGKWVWVSTARNVQKIT